jgi:hypothetical protein
LSLGNADFVRALGKGKVNLNFVTRIGYPFDQRAAFGACAIPSSVPINLQCTRNEPPLFLYHCHNFGAMAPAIKRQSFRSYPTIFPEWQDIE